MRTLARLFVIALLSALGIGLMGSQTANSATLVSAPRMSGTVVLNSTLTVSTGKWIRPSGYKYQWYSCTAKYTRSSTTKPSKCSAISGAKSNRLVLSGALVGKYITVSVSSGSARVFIKTTSGTVLAPPEATTLPSVISVSSPTVGSAVDVSLGRYFGNPAVTANFVAWFECPSRVSSVSVTLASDCVQKTGAAKLHVLQKNSLGKYLVAKVSAVNSVQTRFYYTASTNQVTAAPFTEGSASISSSSLTVGSQITGNDPGWVAFPAATVTFQWYRCDASVSGGSSLGIGCVAIPNATETSYDVTVADLGKYLVFSSSASNLLGSAQWFSGSSEIIESAPVQTSDVSLSGFASVGEPLRADAGTWYSYPSANSSYEWYICDSQHAQQSESLPADCSVLADEQADSLVLTDSMFGKYVLASVTQSNLNGAVTVYSATSGPVNISPKNVVAPFISGVAGVGDELVASSGTWDADPAPSYSYQWYLCDSAIDSVVYLKPSDCAAITGADSSSYTPLISEAGKFIGLAVTAENTLGSKEVFAISSAAVRTLPVLSSNPDFNLLSSTVKPSATAIATSGLWVSYPSATFSYEWYSCASAENCTLLSESSATLDANILTNGDVLKFKVIATNAEGSASAWSASTSTIEQVPALVSAGSVAGDAYEGQTLTLASSTFAGYPDVNVSRSWYLCTSKPAVDAASSLADCEHLADSSLSITVLRSMQDKYLAVLEQATNNNGEAHAWVSASGAVSTLPSLASEPVVSGTAIVASSLSASTGSWTGSPTPSVSYLWFRCDSAQPAGDSLQAGCVETSTTSNSYSVTTADNGKYVGVRVTASNLVGSLSRFSATSAQVGQAPANTVAPMVSGTALVGQSLSTTEGTWTGFPVPTIAYVWYSCSSQVLASSSTLAAGCTAIASSNSTNFSLTSTYAGRYLLVGISASNGFGSPAQVFSASTGFVNQAPANTAAPAITGTARAGSSISVSTGSWSGTATISYSYLWYSCSSGSLASGSLPGTCASTGVTTSSYALTTSNAGSFMVARVTATNGGGSSAHFSASTAAVTDLPVNTVAPAVSGSAIVGQVLTASAGTWTGFPTPTYTYAWYSCTANQTNSASALPAGCTVISGATASSFTLTSTQLSRFITVAVTATNSGGTRSVWSASTGSVASVVTNTVAPSYVSSNAAGEILPGDTLTGSNGTWSGTPTPTLSYRWLRCDSPYASGRTVPNDCVVISGETTTSYTVLDSDVSKYILFAVTGTNTASTLEVLSAGQTKVLQDIAALTQPSLSSTAVGSSAQISLGEWEGYPAVTVDASYEICSVPDDNLYIVNGYDTCESATTTGNTIDLPLDAVGKYLRLTLNVYNDRQNFVNVYSFGQLTGAPAFAYQPTLTGRGEIGQVSSVSNLNIWTYPGAATTTYRWFSCAQALGTPAQVENACTEVTQVGETSSHTTLASEAGRYQVAIVTANNGSSSSVLTSSILIRSATSSDFSSATALKTFSTVPNCSGSNAFNCALNIGSANFNKLVFNSGSIGSTANLTGYVLFDQVKDQLTFSVTNTSGSAQYVDFNSLLTNSDGCLGTINTSSMWVPTGETRTATEQQATLGSFAVDQNCTFGFNLNSMLVGWLSIGKNGATTATAAVALDWPEGFFGNSCLMNVRTVQYSVCENATTVDMATGNDIAVATRITWNATANTLSYSVTNNTASNVFIRLRQGTTGLCHLTAPASITNEITVRPGVTYSPSKATSVSAQTQYDFVSDPFFNAARADCSLTIPGTTSEYVSLVASVSVASASGY